MRKLVVQQWGHADHIVAEEDGALSFVSGSRSTRRSPTTLAEQHDGLHRLGRHGADQRKLSRTVP